MHRRSSFSWTQLGVAMAIAAGALTSLPAQAIVGGTDTTSFVEVGQLGGASGVLVASNWVLTAAHVLDGVTPNLSVFSSGAGSSVVDAVYAYSLAGYPGDDIALVHLATSLDSSVTPILNDQIIDNAAAVNLGVVTIATAQNQSPRGFGLTLVEGALDTFSDGTTTYNVNWLLTNGGTPVENGDSGGALYLGAVDNGASQTLLGLTSAVLTSDTGDTQSAFVQVATYKSWIDSTMANSGQHVVWASAAPEPTSVVLTLMGGVAAVCAARRGRKAA